MAELSAVLIAGPTASGKSALALALAERLAGVVINADSMQVYRDLRVITARPTAADEARVPHRLYGFVAGANAYSAGRFAADAGREIAAAHAAGQMPIIVGGTGLYFRALLDGLSPIPAIPNEIRQRWRAVATELGPSRLHDVLGRRDPVMAARLRATDPQRITRALEVLDATGRSLAEWQTRPGVPVLDVATALPLVIVRDRDDLQRRCDQRFVEIADGEGRNEAAQVARLGLDPGLPLMRAVGLRPLMQLAAGTVDRCAAIAAAQIETRQYVKRQLTWLKSNMITWINVFEQETEQQCNTIMPIIRM